jgi:rRNA maturation endonuclease Nob1
MSITCQICSQVFKKIIPWQHLKKHNITSEEYKERYGSLYSKDTLELLAARIPHNKGKKVTDEDILSNIRKGIDSREKKYREGDLKRPSHKWSDEEKLHLGEKTKEFAKNNPEKMRDRTQKALQTKRDRGTLKGATKGKPISAETREKISTALKNVIQKKTVISLEKIQEKMKSANLTLLSEIKSNISLQLQCNTCNTVFTFTRQYFTDSKFKKEICPTCFPRVKSISKKEQELYDYILSLDADAVQSYRSHYHDREIDIYIPNLKLGFEFNGLYWHSEQLLSSINRDPKSDYLKKIYFNEQGIKLIQIFEDEWINKNDIVKSRIANLLGKTTNKIYARECQVRHLSSKESGDFFKSNHIMASGRSNIRLGLFYKDQLVSAMSFVKNNISRKSNNWEINRFASLLEHTVIGGASKLFKSFIKEVNPITVISYADNRWSDGNLYHTLGFNKTSDGTPNYWYFLPNSNLRIHRYTLRKTNSDDSNRTEYENRVIQGYNRIWDSGSSKWVWQNGVT